MEICEKETWDTKEVREGCQLSLFNRFGLNHVNYLIEHSVYPFDEWTDTLVCLQEKAQKHKNGNASDKCLYYEVTTTQPDRDWETY